ncbi:Pvc16 family protein [Streptosporangium soli]|nr:DUF4255 domain-containing protein [Streptosporangium sp. KLBMP 9127]
MVLLDPTLVTKALAELLRAHIRRSPAWPFTTYGQPLVTCRPPDLLAPGTLGVHLYHSTEEPYLKNQVTAGADPGPIRVIPMAVALYYQVSAVGVGIGEPAAAQEQIMIGCAAEALHDHPVIDDSTTVPRAEPLPPLRVLSSVALDGVGNRFRVTLQPAAHQPVSSSWNAPSPRPALYCRLVAVLLRRATSRSAVRRVVRHEVQNFTGGAPRLDGSQNALTVQVPGLPPRSLVARPAEVPVGGEMTLTGYALSGDDCRLLVQHYQWPGPVEADAGWGVTATDDQVAATVQQQAGGRAITPGQYSARIKVIRRRTLPDGTTHEFPVISNGSPFSISARIDELEVVAGVGTVTGYAFAPPDPASPAFPPDAVQVCVGDAILTESTGAAALAHGEFRVRNAGTLEFRVPADLPAGLPVPLRLFVLGAESPPRWFTP